MRWNTKWCRRGEAFDSRLNVGIVRELPVDLAILIVRTINWLQREELNRIWRKMGCVPLFLRLSRTVLDFVGGTQKTRNDMPWSSEGERKLINAPSRGVRSYSPTCKNDITHRINFGVGSLGFNEFTVPCSLFLDEDFGNLTRRLKVVGKVSGI